MVELMLEIVLPLKVVAVAEQELLVHLVVDLLLHLTDHQL